MGRLRQGYLSNGELTWRQLEDEEIATLLNGSNVDHLVLGMNWLDSRGTSVFFNALDAPSLTCLFMDHCCLAGDVVPAVADFVAAPRTNGLVDLVLRRNADFDVAQCTCILDAIEGANYTLLSVTAVLPDDVPVFLRRRAEDLETRNNLHHTRLIRATLKGLVAARIILHGRQPIAEDGDMEDTGTDTDSSRRRRRRGSRTPSPVYVRNTYRWALHRDQAGSAASQSQQPEAEDPSRQQETIVPGTERQQASPPRPFPLLRLPREIQLLIARYCTEDETALSESQWRRVIRHASDPDSLSRKARDWAAWCHRVKARVPMEKRLVREFLWTQMKELGCFSWEWNEGRAPPLPTAVAASV